MIPTLNDKFRAEAFSVAGVRGSCEGDSESSAKSGYVIPVLICDVEWRSARDSEGRFVSGARTIGKVRSPFGNFRREKRTISVSFSSSSVILKFTQPRDKIFSK
jgi:hypothetical protein